VLSGTKQSRSTIEAPDRVSTTFSISASDSPPLEGSLDIALHTGSRGCTVETCHEQHVIVGLLMSNASDHGQLDCGGIGCAPCCAATHSPTSARRGVIGNRTRPCNGAAGEEAQNLSGERLEERLVLRSTTYPVALPSPLSRLRICETFPLGCINRCRLDEDALALVASPGPAEAHDHGREGTRAPRAASESGVPCRQKHEVAQIRAHQAQRPLSFHHQQLTGPAALRAGPRPECRDGDELRRLRLNLHNSLSLASFTMSG
jgi:hypothetical protein